jgi:hypothetical protein
MMIVMAIIGMIAALTFPSAAAGLDGLRLRSTCDETVAFLYYGMTYSERRQETVFLVIPADRTSLRWRTRKPGALKEYTLPDGLRFASVRMGSQVDPGEADRVIPLSPGAPFPKLTLEIINRRGARRLVRIDPVAGVPEVAPPQEANDEKK